MAMTARFTPLNGCFYQALLEFARKALAVHAVPIELKCIARLGAIAHALIELLKDWFAASKMGGGHREGICGSGLSASEGESGTKVLSTLASVASCRGNSARHGAKAEEG